MEKADSWDRYFMDIANLVSTRSKCLSRKAGAVLVKDNHIIATGYNGPPKGIPHCNTRYASGVYAGSFQSHECPRQRMQYKSGEGLEHCPSVHGEINPILQAARYGHITNGTTLYCNCATPCTSCSKELINAGVVRIVCTGLVEYGSGLTSKSMLEQAGIKLEVLGG